MSAEAGEAADKARLARGIPTERLRPVNSRWWNPRERRAGEAPGWAVGRNGCISTETQRRFSRDGSPAEPPPGAGRGGPQFSRWVSRAVWPPPPGELARGIHHAFWIAGRGENWAAWVSLPAVWPGWIASRAPTGRTGPRGFHHRLFGRDASPLVSGAGRKHRVDPARGAGPPDPHRARTPRGFCHRLPAPDAGRDRGFPGSAIMQKCGIRSRGATARLAGAGRRGRRAGPGVDPRRS